MTFYENYLRLCNQLGKSPSAVAIEAKVGKPAVSRWKAGTKPRDATITKLAAYFNVPVEELMGDGTKKGPAQMGEVDKETAELQDIWNSADDDERRALLEVARLIRRKKG